VSDTPNDTQGHPPSSADGLARPTVEEAQAAVRTLLAYMGEDPAREGLVETPSRVIRAMGEHFAGYGQNPETYLSKVFEEV